MAISVRVEELRTFLSNLKIDSILEVDGNIATYSVRERDLHAVLLWGLELDLYSDRELLGWEIYAKEFISDVSSANLCALLGLYKASLMLVRSGIENFSKAILARNSLYAEDTKSVYEINDRFKSYIDKGYSIVSKSGHRIMARYVELCKYVHSAGPDFMNLAVAYADLLKADAPQAMRCFIEIQELCRDASAVLLAEFGEPAKIHHRQRDQILDRLPRLVKKAVLGT